MPQLLDTHAIIVDILKRKISMVLEVSPGLLRVTEPIDDMCCNYGILHTLIDF